jgi:hypothetical protein
VDGTENQYLLYAIDDPQFGYLQVSDDGANGISLSKNGTSLAVTNPADGNFGSPSSSAPALTPPLAAINSAEADWESKLNDLYLSVTSAIASYNVKTDRYTYLYQTATNPITYEQAQFNANFTDLNSIVTADKNYYGTAINSYFSTIQSDFQNFINVEAATGSGGKEWSAYYDMITSNIATKAFTDLNTFSTWLSNLNSTLGTYINNAKTAEGKAEELVNNLFPVGIDSTALKASITAIEGYLPTLNIDPISISYGVKPDK